MLGKLIEKYNVPAPRYTSYPTVPFWDKEKPATNRWLDVVSKTFSETNGNQGISLYIHLPYCESLCTYCACNTRITKNHTVEETYIDSLLKEWQIYLDTFSEKPIIRELHLGGGTPTFFSPDNLKVLIKKILKDAVIHPKHDFSFEGHPNNTSEEHLKALYEVGFRRVSYGVQDLDLKVQKTINRVQPFENVKNATFAARKIGYDSVNFDLIFGLPYQTRESITETFHKVLELKPNRIAFYSYAHVPWVKPGQRSYTDADLPDNEVKRSLYETGKELLVQYGYHDIGMDHFALPDDGLFHAHKNKQLHRNFMGYTVSNTQLLIGLGCSSISDAKYAYAQNMKRVEDYRQCVEKNSSAIFKGHFLNEEDQVIRKIILDLACKGETQWFDEYDSLIDEEMRVELLEMQAEGLLSFGNRNVVISEMGKAFIRNICMVFDKRLNAHKTCEEPLFSKAI
ncbi:oxygen-independent coproporphyrinogen III oxidase [Fulvivirgaceae bacterium BMA10]|uniref:Coproporphyrinogen-III oxidase n=1 Tax=Splendidivirga corallicola TaxID=3051826 RepID=A0ABT8KW78_9BACT|nr:oxygen-independent coproporphyrinogen III oxidase [Fulvivirgaceae bacterium BMA10]